MVFIIRGLEIVIAPELRWHPFKKAGMWVSSPNRQQPIKGFLPDFFRSLIEILIRFTVDFLRARAPPSSGHSPKYPMQRNRREWGRKLCTIRQNRCRTIRNRRRQPMADNEVGQT